MNILDALKHTANTEIISSTTVLIKDDCEFRIDIGKVSELMNVICRKKIEYSAECKKELIRRIISINDNSDYMMGTFWINTETKELELRANLIVDCNPTPKKLEDIISRMAASVSSCANSLETREQTV